MLFELHPPLSRLHTTQHGVRTTSIKVNAVEVLVSIREDHYPVCRLDIQQDSEFATGYGYAKTAFKREPDTDPDIRNAFIDISRI